MDEDKGDQHQRINGTGWGWGSVHSDGTKPAFSPKSPGSALGMKRLLGYASGFSGTRGPWHEGHDASSAEGGIRGTGRSHREDSEQGLATTFTMKLGRVHRAPPRWLVAEATDRVTGSPASPPHLSCFRLCGLRGFHLRRGGIQSTRIPMSSARRCPCPARCQVGL